MNLESELSFDRLIMDEINHMIFVIDVENGTNFNYKFLNHSALYETGATKSVIGKPIQATFPNRISELLYKYCNEIMSTNRGTRTYKDSYLVPSGKRYYFETKMIPYFNERKEYTQIVAIVRNITLQKWLYTEAKKHWDKYNESKSHYLSLRAADTGYSAFGELLFLYILYSAPVFILGGLVASFVIERMNIESSFFKKHTYLTDLILYAIAGVVVGALFLFVVSEGGNAPHGFHYGYFSVLCIAGSVLFYHLNMVIKKWFPPSKRMTLS